MADTRKVLDSVTLRFDGDEKSGADLHELRASDVAQVLQGLAELVSDFDKAGAFHEVFSPESHRRQQRHPNGVA